MVSNDSHTWVTVKNGSDDMVSSLSPLPMPLENSYGALFFPGEVYQFCVHPNQPGESDGERLSIYALKANLQ